MTVKLNKVKETKAKKELFRQDSFVVPEEVLEWLKSLIVVCNEDGQQQALHNFVCSLNKIWEADGWVPNPHDFVRKFFPTSNMELLLESGIMSKWWYSHSDHRCNMYAWNFETLLEYADRTVKALMNPDCKLVNAFTGRKAHPVKSTATDESGHKVPEIVETHIRSYAACIFNRTRTLRFFKEKKLELTRLKYELGVDHPDYIYASQCFIACCASFKAVVACNPVHLQGDLWIYNPPYKTQGSGRLTHIGGGPQNALFEMQCAMFADIPGYKNYDMVSSQPNGVIQWLEEANLDSSWLVEYRDTPKAKHVYSGRTGMSPECWKDCLNSILMGTQVVEPGLNKQGKDKIQTCFLGIVHGTVSENNCGALFQYILKECKGDAFKATRVYHRFYQVVEPLVAVMKQWHDWLLKVYLLQNLKNNRSGSYIIGACGTKLYLDDLTVQQKKCQVAAFLLQSREARYVAEIARLAPQYGYMMKQNFHDGFVCEGEVPVEAQQEAAKLAGLTNAALGEKPFTNPYAEQEAAQLERAREINLRALFTGRAIEDLTEEEQNAIHQTEQLEELAKKWGLLDSDCPFEDISFETEVEVEAGIADCKEAETIVEEEADICKQYSSLIGTKVVRFSEWIRPDNKVYEIWKLESDTRSGKVRFYFDASRPHAFTTDMGSLHLLEAA
jgi:hypothetical protein